MKFLKFYLNEDIVKKKDWRSRYIFHTTKTGQRRRVMIGSLSPEEMERFRPPQFKKKHINIMNKEPEIKKTPHKYIYDLFVGIENESVLDNLEGKLIKATDNSSKAIEFDNMGLIIKKVFNVPIGAIQKYKNDEDEWVEFDKDMTDKQKYEFIKFNDENDMFLVNLFPYLDDLQISDGGEESDEEGEGEGEEKE